MKKIYCVTGAAGHLGNNIVQNLVSRGETVRAFVLPGQDVFMLEGAQIYYGNTCEKETLKPFLAHDDEEEVYVIHAAAIVSITEKFDKKVFDVNVGGTKNVVDVCMESGVKKLVHISSVHAVKTEKNVLVSDCTVFDETRLHGNYAKSKAMATKYVLEACEKGLNACVLMPGGIIGIRDYNHNHLMEMFKSYISGKLPAAVKGEYDFVDVLDVADAAVKATEKGRSGQCYFITGENRKIKELLDMAGEALGLKKMRVFLPLSVARAFAPVCEAYYRAKKKTPLFTKYSLAVLDSGDKFSHEKATRELDYHPRDIKETVTQTVRWLVESGITAVSKKMRLKTSARRARLTPKKAR